MLDKSKCSDRGVAVLGNYDSSNNQKTDIMVLRKVTFPIKIVFKL